MMRTTRSLQKSTLLAGAALAAWLAALPSAVAAQALQGTPTTVAGSAPVITTAPNFTQIAVRSPQTVINWTPFDTGSSGTIDFLPVGATAAFVEPGGTFDYTVLNRILPADASGIPVNRPVAFNGTLTSQSGNFTGGQIWFYSPTGIIAGPTAVFNVGSLILTTNDIPFVPGPAGSVYGPGGLVAMQGPAGSTGFVDIRSGAQITASGSVFSQAYIAVVAPRIVQAGRVAANGNIAYLAAEQVDLTINGGLFDFVLTVGTEDPEGLVHTGTTTGPASTGLADLQRISMVALPKNDALTMMLSGTIGYAPAAVAANDGSSVVLAAGFNGASPSADPGNRLGSISIGNATFYNALTGYASNNVAIAPVGGTASFEEVSAFHALNDISLIAASGEQVTALVDLNLYAGEPGAGGNIVVESQGTGVIDIARQFGASSRSAAFFGMAPGDAQGGTITVDADGGTINALEAFFDASAAGGFGDATGGTISLTAGNGGSMTFTNFVSLTADASGGTSAAGGNAAGGAVNMTVSNGTIAAGSLFVSAGGYGGYGPTSGGDGIGGTIALNEADGQFALGAVSLSAGGTGSFSDGQGGSGTGGQVAIALTGQAQTWSDLFAGAVASAGTGLTGSGRATGAVDAISLTLTGPSSLTIASSVALDADARVTANTALGVNSLAGGVTVAVDQGAALAVGGAIEAHADIIFGVEGPPAGSTTTPDVQAGTVSIVSHGSLTTTALTATANATGASADTRAGTATGGTVSVSAADGGSIGIDDGAGGGALILLANASGMTGPVPAHAQGGTALLIADGGSITALGAATVEATAQMPLFLTPDGPGFDATGGTASVELLPNATGTSAIAVGSLDVRAIGDARPMQFDFILGTAVPAPVVGDGGAGRGGTASVTQAAGTLSAGSMVLDATGFGAASAASTGPAAFVSGDGFGGIATFSATGGSGTVAALAILARGAGGGGAPSAAGSELAALAGGGSGGTAELLVSNGVLVAPTISIEAPGLGADGMSHTGDGDGTDGGFGNGGNALFTMFSGGTGSLTASALDLNAEGHGGAGGASATGAGGSGGEGTGGSAIASLGDNAFALGPFRALADGVGGDGATGGATDGAGGDGHGGAAEFALVDAFGPSGARSVAGLGFYASGIGGTSAGGAVAPGDGGTVTIDVSTFDSASALDVGGDLDAFSRGTDVGPGPGFSLAISGAMLTIDGVVRVDTQRDAAITAGQPLAANGTFTLYSHSLTETGLVAADSIGISSPAFIDAEQLRSGGATTLLAADGPLSVDDLVSFGDVLAQARSVDIASSGGLSFSLAQATAGDLTISTAGDLLLPIASATGSMDLTSLAGLISSDTGLLSGGAFSARAQNDVDLAVVGSDGGTLLQSTLGDVSVASLSSAGTVAVTANDVAIGSSGDLAFTTAEATGTMAVTTAGNLAFAAVSAGSDLDLEATFGALTATGNVTGGPTTLVSGNDIALDGSLTVGGPLVVVAGGSFTVQGDTTADSTDITADSGIVLASLASGGTTSLLAANGPLAVGNLASTGEVTAGALSIDLASTGALAFANAQATAGDQRIATQGNLSLIQGGASGALDLSSTSGAFSASGPLTAGGNAAIVARLGVTAASLSSGGTTLLRATGGVVDIGSLTSVGQVRALGRAVDIVSPGALAFADLDATAGALSVVTADSLSLATADATGAVTLRSIGGGITATGAVNAGSVSFASAGDMSFQGVNSAGTTVLDAGGTVDIANLLSTGEVTAAAGDSLFIDGTGPLAFTTAEALNEISIITSGDLALGSVNAGFYLTLHATDGSLTATGDVGGLFPDIFASGNILIGGDLHSAGSLAVNAGGSFTVVGDAFSDDASIFADGGITMTSLHAGEQTSLIADNGNIVVPELTTGLVVARGLDVDIGSSGSLYFAEATASSDDVTIRTAGNLGANSLFANNAIDLDSGGTFTLNGEARAATIGVVSSDIEIDGEVGQLGVRGVTSTITLRNGDSESRTFIGGEAQDGDYSLDKDEAARLFADQSITLLAPESITVGDLALSFGNGERNIGAGGLLEISTPDEVRVTGEVLLNTSSADDTFRIDPRLIALDTDTGSISMFTGEGGGGTPLGRLAMTGDTVAVATGATLSQLTEITDFAAINALLDQPGGAPEPLRAGTMTIEVVDGLYIQNTGASDAYDDRRGFTTGALEIATELSGTRIAINGQILTADGPAGGLDTAPLVTINGAPAAAGGQFDAGSTINGCVIGGNCRFVPPPPPEMRPGDPPPRDSLEPLSPDTNPPSLFVTPIIELAGSDPLIEPPLVDEPITGIGNDDLWEPYCDPADTTCAEGDGRP